MRAVWASSFAVFVGLLALGCSSPTSGPATTPATQSSPASTTPKFTVTYDPNGATAGTAPVDTGSYAQGGRFTVLGSGTLSKAGSFFSGWNTAQGGGGTAFVAGNSANMGGVNLVLYAQWGPAYTVTYNAGVVTSVTSPVDGAGHGANTSVTVMGSGSMVKTGYALAGWTTSLTGPGSSYAASASFTMGSSNVDLYPVWIPNNLTFSSFGANIYLTGSTSLSGSQLDIPAGVTGISGSFTSNSTVTDVSIPASVTYIGTSPFSSFYNLLTISVDAANTAYQSISGVLLNKAGTSLVEVPMTFTSYAIPSTVTTIEGNAFFDGHITTINIPSNVQTVSGQAFMFCPLTSLTISSGLTKIGLAAFGSTNITTVNLPASVSSIDGRPFYGCLHLSSISVDSGNPYFVSQAGVLFDHAGTTLIEAPGAISGAYVVPGTVRTIADEAFSSCSLLTAITITSGVTTIGIQAFAYCSGLTAISLPSSIASIKETAFYDCSSLTSLTMENSSPPALQANTNVFVAEASGFKIHLPSIAAITTYSGTSGWSDYSGIFVTP